MFFGVDPVRVLGERYRLVERLGEGGMSIVWRAYDEVLNRQVAIKVLAGNADGPSRERIRGEARAAARLTHPHITSVHDFGEARGESGELVPYVVMELVRGPTLSERLKAGRLPVGAALLICAQVAAALAAAHARGLVHRDVKPGNVMLSPAGAKVMDFGIAAVAGDLSESPVDGEIWGTPAYLAPERLTGGEVLPASDVYALGLLLYRLLAGRPVWRAETVTQMLLAHQYEEPAPLPPLDGVPEPVAVLCQQCLAKRPEDRPSAGEAARVLAEASGGDLAVGVGGAAADDEDPDTQMVPRAALAGRPASPAVSAIDRAAHEPGATERSQRPWAALAISSLVVLAVVLLAGWCAGPYREPAGPTAPTTASGATSGPASRQPTPSVGGAPAVPSATTRGGTAPRTGGGGPAGGGGGGGGGGTTRPATPRERSVETPGGSATCRCTGPTAYLVSWDPLPGFTPTQINRGPAEVVGLVFDAVATDVRVTFRCNGGTPVASVEII